MKKLILGFLAIAATNVAMADNALTNDQLTTSIQESLKDYANVEPGMMNSISGLKVVTVGPNAQVTIEMKADGMNMSAKYTCAPKNTAMLCQLQQ